MLESETVTFQNAVILVRMYRAQQKQMVCKLFSQPKNHHVSFSNTYCYFLYALSSQPYLLNNILFIYLRFRVT